MKRRWPWVAAASGLFAVVLLAGLLDATLREPAACGSFAAGSPSIGGPLPPIDHTGTRRAGALGELPMLVYFGYTSCPGICPVDAQRMGRVAEELEERGIDVKPVFVTVDPQRDTPEILAEFVETIHPRAVGLTGTPRDIGQAASDWRIHYRRGEGDDEFYLMDHSTLTYLADAEGAYRAHFGRDSSVEDMVSTTACLRETGRI